MERSNSGISESISASLSGMVVNEMDTEIPVQMNDASKAGQDTNYTGNARLNLDLNSLLAKAESALSSAFNVHPNAKYWPIEGPNHSDAVITINVTLPEGTDAQFSGAGTSTNNSSLISNVTVTPSGKTATVSITLL